MLTTFLLLLTQRRAVSRHFVVEGIGGVMVPIAGDGYLMIELTRRLKLPCVLVARSTLGTINHTLLTIEALRRRKISLAGVIMNGPKNRENRGAIEQFGNTVILGEIDVLNSVTATKVAATARRIDRRAILKQFLVER